MEPVNNIEALLLDDLHLLVSSRSVQERLIEIIRPLIDTGRQVVFASRKPLNELTGFDEAPSALLLPGMTIALNQIHSFARLD